MYESSIPGEFTRLTSLEVLALSSSQESNADSRFLVATI